MKFPISYVHISNLRSRLFPSHYTTIQRRLNRMPTYVIAVLKSRNLFNNMDSTEEVTQWLRALDLSQYVPVFRSNAVTAHILLTLNSFELRETLCVTNISHRRTMLNAISYLRQAHISETGLQIPEHGTILTHLSNERIFVGWARFSVIMVTVAVATVRLENSKNLSNHVYVKAVSVVLAVTAILTLFYGTRRYFRMCNMIENPGEDHVPEQTIVTTPLFIAVIATIIALYATMAQETEEAALLALIAV